MELLARGLAGALAVFLTAAPALAADPRGVVPEGFWVLDIQKSKELQPGDQTLWIIKDDGRTLTWVSTLRDGGGRVHVASYDGVYGGALAAVTGAPMRTKISSPGAGRLHNEGEMVGVGHYEENCILQDGKVFVCDGAVQGAKGVQRWHDHFVYAGPSPTR